MASGEEKSKRDSRRAKTQSIKKRVMTSDYLGKCHAHPVKRSEPQVCPDCRGTGYTDTRMECFTCGGEGEI